MKNYTTTSQDIYTVKRSVLHFSSQLSAGMQKPNKNFLMDMLFGLVKSNSVLLSDIARALNEPIDIIQTIKRLSSRLELFHEEELLHENYKNMVGAHFKEEDNLVIVDKSEVIKPYSSKSEALGYVKDGSTGKIERGYWTTNMIGITKDTKHPISMYSHLYSSAEDGFISENEETFKGFQQVRDILNGKKATFVMDRGYDNVRMMKRVLEQKDNFIIRLKRNRHLRYQNKQLTVRELALRRKGKINFQAEIKGAIYQLKVSHIAVEIPSLKGHKLTMIVVYGYGKDPMVLLTNKQVRKKDEVLSILKAYILRWRIEEMFRVQKNELNLESVRVRSLKKLNLMFFMVSAIITYMSLKVEKQNIFFHRVVDRARSIKSIHHIKMFLYRFIAGMKEILKKDTKGVKHFKYPERRNRMQLVLRL